MRNISHHALPNRRFGIRFPDSGGEATPPARARCISVTRNLLSYSKDTLLCSDESFRQAESGSRTCFGLCRGEKTCMTMNIKIRPKTDCGRTDLDRGLKPCDVPCRLGTKVEAYETTSPKPKTPKAIIPTPQAIIHFQSDKSCDFSLFICQTNQRMAIGCNERILNGTTRRTIGRFARRTYVARTIATDRPTLRPTNVGPLGHWAEHPFAPTG